MSCMGQKGRRWESYKHRVNALFSGSGPISVVALHRVHCNNPNLPMYGQLWPNYSDPGMAVVVLLPKEVDLQWELERGAPSNCTFRESATLLKAGNFMTYQTPSQNLHLASIEPQFIQPTILPRHRSRAISAISNSDVTEIRYQQLTDDNPLQIS